MRAGDVERDPGLTAVAPGGAAGPRVLVLSEHHLIAQGIVDLLPDGWQDSAVIAAGLGELDRAKRGSVSAVVIDATLPDAGRAAVLARAIGASVIVLVPSATAAVDQGLYEHADAILIRDEVEPRVLRLALAAGRVGMRLLPRALTVGAQAAPAAPTGAAVTALGEPAMRALALLADGMRDAEIALELSLSESAVRKLIQRAVKRSGARTRCQAVAAAVRGQ